MNGKEMLKRLKNTGTVITIASLVVLILATNGLNIDNERVMTTIKSICSILVILGIMNNSETDGLDLPFIKKGGK